MKQKDLIIINNNKKTPLKGRKRIRKTKDGISCIKKVQTNMIPTLYAKYVEPTLLFYKTKNYENVTYLGRFPLLGCSCTWPWDFMILTALNILVPKVPMYKNSESICIPSKKYFL